ncbi:helix-turn-helix domain-containing protein [Kribbella sp. NPDC050820]|uniref:helix-turn-helix domain-containing protein n=1 Tax=Kribbella sp. NPDC050820 TaxID=3155408 RepID=UPI0033F5F2AB
MREASSRFLPGEERIEIAGLHQAGVSVCGVADPLSRAPSAISRELLSSFRRAPSCDRPAGHLEPRGVLDTNPRTS